jgi:predicted HAD superfamily Cof-like phosphohydrolase
MERKITSLKMKLIREQQYENASLARDIEREVPFIDEVEKFNNVMGKGWQNRTKPTIDKKDAQFVVNFIDEELQELKEAVAERDIVGILDAILDITYVGLGNGALVFGLKDKILPGYAEVQASNMSKICKTEEEAQKTVQVRSEEQGEPCHYEGSEETGYVVYRTRDMKVMKSINYFSPDLRQFFTEEELRDI